MNNYIPYPYPVLGNDNDIEGHFTPSMTYSMNPSTTTLNIKFSLENDYIKKLIDEHKASFLIDVSCARTYYRKAIKTDDYEYIFTEPSQNLRGKITVEFYICTNEPIDDYSPNGEPFFVEGGDIIAVGGSASFVAEKEYDPLKAPIKSIMKITCLDKAQDEFTVLYNDNEFITIGIPKDMYTLYVGARNNAAELLHSSIVLPALMDAIDAMKGRGGAKDGEFANSAWAQKLTELCFSRGIDLDSDSLVIAQKLLSNPAKRALDWYNKNNEAEEE